MIPRKRYLSSIAQSFEIHSAVALLGPRQCGKTTLAKMFAGVSAHTFFDLENPTDLARLSAPMQTLGELEGLTIIDEIQRKPELFEILRVLLDRPDNPARFLLLGSASPLLIRGVSESLAGRIGYVDLSGFDCTEVGSDALSRLWHRGGFPLSFLGTTDAASFAWRNDFIRSFLERDIPQLGISIPAESIRRFWIMVAHYHGNVWNAAEFARSLGSAEETARRYLDILKGTFMVRSLQPWFENLKKRQVKSPKVYLRDTGLLHALLSLDSMDAVKSHPKLGASWEGFALEQVLAVTGTRDAYFWATHTGAELDLFFMSKGKKIGFEFKYADAPVMTKSLRVAFDDLGLDHAYIVYPGTDRYSLGAGVDVVPIAALRETLAEVDQSFS
jgi:predicted AAA+ superfamily ATPase